jgi:hypothetical protein
LEQALLSVARLLQTYDPNGIIESYLDEWLPLTRASFGVG